MTPLFELYLPSRRPVAAVALRLPACDTCGRARLFFGAYPCRRTGDHFAGLCAKGAAAMHRRRFIASALAAGAGLVARSARAAGFPDPSRTLRVIVPFAAGGGV